MQNALEISIKVWKNIHLKMTCQNAEVGTIILVSLIIGALVAFALYLDFKREELIFKRSERKKQNAEVGTIILVSLLMIGALVALALYLDFKREEPIFKRSERKKQKRKRR